MISYQLFNNANIILFSYKNLYKANLNNQNVKDSSVYNKFLCKINSI